MTQRAQLSSRERPNAESVHTIDIEGDSDLNCGVKGHHGGISFD
jgi:hypothetical protein